MYSTTLSDQVSHIFRELRNMLLLDPERELMVLDPNRNFMKAPYFRTWKGDQRLRHHPVKRSAVPATYRGDLYTSAGIRPGEVNPKDPAKANLSDLDRKSVV